MSVTAEPILLDNCAISACHQVGGWSALASRYRLETVREVESEAATGFQHRDTIDPRTFRKQVLVHDVSLAAKLELMSQFEDLATLDAGERDLWIHALSRTDGWILCGPDIASIRFGVQAGFADRLKSLEELLGAIGFKPKPQLQAHQTKKWLQQEIGKIRLQMAFKKV